MTSRIPFPDKMCRKKIREREREKPVSTFSGAEDYQHPSSRSRARGKGHSSGPSWPCRESREVVGPERWRWQVAVQFAKGIVGWQKTIWKRKGNNKSTERDGMSATVRDSGVFLRLNWKEEERAIKKEKKKMQGVSQFGRHFVTFPSWKAVCQVAEFSSWKKKKKKPTTWPSPLTFYSVYSRSCDAIFSANPASGHLHSPDIPCLLLL